MSNSSRTSSSFSNSASRNTSQSSSNRSPTRSEKSTASGSSRPGSPPTDSVAAWLRHHRLQKHTAILAPLSFDTLVSLSEDDLARLGVAAKGSRAKLLRELAAYKQQHLEQVEEPTNHVDAHRTEGDPADTTPETDLSSPSYSTDSPKSSKSEYVGYCLGNPASDASLRIVTKDSIENLALPAPPNITLSAPPQKTIFSIENSPITDSSKTACSAPAEKTAFSTDEITPASPPKSSKKCRKALKVQINGADFDLEKDTTRPLSPFTSSGMLRRLLSPMPSSAPANITAFGPTIDDEVAGMLTEMESGREGKSKGKGKEKEKAKVCLARTTRAERGGGILRRILGKRIGRCLISA